MVYDADRHRPGAASAGEAAEVGASPGRATLTEGLADAPASRGAIPRLDLSPATSREAVPRLDLVGRPGGDADGTGGSGPAAHLEDFARSFNAEFAAQLHAFATDELPAAERGPMASDRSVTPTAHSGDGVSAERLARLFTPTQIEKLAAFISTRQIPDRLFNGDDVGGRERATAQQRILLAGHILAVGEYVPGSFAQRLHARMCGHWATLVYHYAGAGQSGGAGIIENFDHTGGLSLSVTDTTAEDGAAAVSATRRTGAAAARREFQDESGRTRYAFEGLPFEQYATIEPGDWLWINNNSGSAGGNHSAIFSRWASPELRADASGRPLQEGSPDYEHGIRYRRAIMMSQGSPGAGGQEEARLLGERRVPIGTSAHVAPVTRIIHVDPSTRPLQRMEDVVALLGTNPRSSSANERFLQRLSQRGGIFDTAAFIAYLRGRNRTLIDALAAHMTPLQADLFRQTNEADHGGSEHGTIGTLVRLHQRLTNLVHDAETLDSNQARRRAEVDTDHRDAERRLRPRRDDLEAQRAEAEATVAALEQERREAAARLDLLDDVPPQLRAARAERREHRPALRARLRAAETEAERAEIRAELAALDDEVERQEAREHEGRPELRAQRTAVQRLGRQITREQRHVDRLDDQLQDLQSESGYLLVADGVRGDTFQGRGEARVTGLLEDLTPAPPWAQFVTRAAPES